MPEVLFSHTIECKYFLNFCLQRIKRIYSIAENETGVINLNNEEYEKEFSDIFKHFDFAVIGGEFYEPHQEIINEIGNELDKISKLLDEPNIKINILTHAVGIYKKLISYKSKIHPSILKLDDASFFYAQKSNTLKWVESVIDNSDRSINKDNEWFSLFNINVLLALQETSLRCEVKNLRNLREIEELLSNPVYKSYTSLQILEEKVRFLSYKAHYRLPQSEDFAKEDSSRIKNEEKKFYYFKSFHEGCVKVWKNKDFTFDDTLNEHEIIGERQKSKIKESPPSLSTFHFLNKYYKFQLSKNPNLENNINEIQCLVNTLNTDGLDTSTFDGYSMGTIINLLNCTLFNPNKSLAFF